MESMFTALGKYNSPVHENYLTEAFVYVLKYMLIQERRLGKEVLSRLCYGDRLDAFEHDSEVALVTQKDAGGGSGRPDITIITPSKLIYVEVKHDSGLGERQLGRYREALRNNTPAGHEGRLVLLTRFPESTDGQDGNPEAFARWQEVHRWFAAAPVDDAVVRFLVQQFCLYLEEKAMSLNKVSRDYVDGLSAFRSLMGLIAAALERNGLTKLRNSAGQDWQGFYVGKHDNDKFGAFVYYSNPTVVVYEIARNTSVIFHKELDLDANGFYQGDVDMQLECLSGFFRRSHSEALLQAGLRPTELKPLRK